uniref:Uncharacterized protein n=1 Tax=Leersia perrieri TaxID=77586 RepID=A0A0D9XN33_9ORYZ
MLDVENAIWGYSIGTRLVDEFLAKSDVSRRVDFKEIADVIAKVLLIAGSKIVDMAGIPRSTRIHRLWLIEEEEYVAANNSNKKQDGPNHNTHNYYSAANVTVSHAKVTIS